MRYDTLVSAARLAQHLDDPDWRVVDCRFDLAATDHGARDYRQGHIPGLHPQLPIHLGFAKRQVVNFNPIDVGGAQISTAFHPFGQHRVGVGKQQVSPWEGNASLGFNRENGIVDSAR